MKPENSNLEPDSRFPSGPWIGFFLDARLPGKHRMQLRLTFQNGTMTGEGRDWVGDFIIRGRYTIDDGKCHFNKRYVGRHDVHYTGFNEGKGIWGTWELTDLGLTFRGGFHIWPEGMPDPSKPQLEEEAVLPIAVEEPDEKVSEAPVKELVISRGSIS